MKRAALALKSGLVRPSISQALSNDASRQSFGTHGVIDAQCNAVVVAEIELGKITMQVLFGTVLVGAAPRRLVWGSDWPHPAHKGVMPNDADLLDLLLDWIPDEGVRKQILVDNPAAL